MYISPWTVTILFCGLLDMFSLYGYSENVSTMVTDPIHFTGSRGGGGGRGREGGENVK
jgi:hypothetical protein